MNQTKKSPEIEKLMTSISGLSRQEAILKNQCTWCRGPVEVFRDQLSLKEFSISGLCQNCQDKVFNEKDFGR